MAIYIFFVSVVTCFMFQLECDKLVIECLHKPVKILMNINVMFCALCCSVLKNDLL